MYNNSVCQTPNLDSLASRSVIMRHAFTAVSSCSPSRSAILTGLPIHRSGQFGLAQSENNFHTYDVVKSLPGILKTAGINTGNCNICIVHLNQEKGRANKRDILNFAGTF